MFPNAKIWKHFSIFTYINKLVDNNKMMKIGRGFSSIINGKRMTMNNYIVEEYDYLHTAVVPDPATDVILSVSPEEDYTESHSHYVNDKTGETVGKICNSVAKHTKSITFRDKKSYFSG